MGLKQHPLRLRKQIPALSPVWAEQSPSLLVNPVPAGFGRQLAVKLSAKLLRSVARASVWRLPVHFRPNRHETACLLAS